MAKKRMNHQQMKHVQVIKLSRWLTENDGRLIDRNATREEAVGLASTELGFPMSLYAFKKAAEASEVKWRPPNRLRVPSAARGLKESVAFRREVSYLLQKLCEACDVTVGPIVYDLANEYAEVQAKKVQA